MFYLERYNNHNKSEKIARDQKVVVIEDLISTGNSSLEACQSLISENLKIKGLISIFNYNFEISKLNFESKNISYS